MKNIWKLIVSIGICQAVALIGSVLTISSIQGWYTTLNKPSFNPPNWIFGPVWTTLFVLMGISLFLVWSKGSKSKKSRIAFKLFFAQLGLNLLWSAFFFGVHSPLLAFVDIIILWIMILFTILKFSKISKLATYLLIPYILWVSFAMILNFFIVRLN